MRRKTRKCECEPCLFKTQRCAMYVCMLPWEGGWGLLVLGCLCGSGHTTPSCTPAPRSWPRLSCCSGHSPRLSGVPQNLPCTVPRLMSCPPAYSAQPALCLRPCPQPPGSQSQPATPRSPAHQPINVLSALILPQDPPPWEMIPMCFSSSSGIGGPPKD